MNISKNGRKAKWKRYVQIKIKTFISKTTKIGEQIIATKKKYPKTVQILGVSIRLILMLKSWE